MGLELDVEGRGGFTHVVRKGKVQVTRWAGLAAASTFIQTAPSPSYCPHAAAFIFASWRRRLTANST